MKFIQVVVFCGNLLLLLAVNIYLWTLSPFLGVGGIAGIAAFFIAYSISGPMTIAPRDYWKCPQYDIFKRKLAYGNSIAGCTTVIVSAIIFAIFQ